MEKPPPETLDLHAVIHKGTDPNVDLVMNALHRICLRNFKLRARVSFGGEDGMRITRACYAVILQFNDLSEDWMNCVNDVELDDCDE